MLAEERFAMILDLLAQKRSATVLELCDALDASESTIRRDLTQLDRQGLLKKVHGGATLVGRTVLADEPPMAAREEQSVEEKRLIARAAAAMITEKDFIFLDAGSTTLALSAYRPEEKDRAQAAINFCVYATLALSAFSSGVLVTTQGWTLLNAGSLVPIVVTGLALAWLGLQRQRVSSGA